MQLGTPGAEAQPLGSQPRPRLLARAASEVADSTAFDRQALDTDLSSLHNASVAALRLAPALGRAAARAQLYAASALLVYFSLAPPRDASGLLGRTAAGLCALPLALAAACNLAAACQGAPRLASLHAALPDAAATACSQRPSRESRERRSLPPHVPPGADNGTAMERQWNGNGTAMER